MMRRISVLVIVFCGILTFIAACTSTDNNQPIDRKALVTRHNVDVNSFDTLASLTVGNGEFAFTVDATGLQTYPELYEKGICLGTQSQWGWHSFPDTVGYTYGETLKYYNFHGRQIGYYSQLNEPPISKAATDYLRINPHRLHLGIVGLEILSKEGNPVPFTDIKNIKQELNLWKGEIKSSFTVNGEPVEVTTYCHQQFDLISAKITSPLIAKGLLKVRLKFPYASGKHVDSGCDWQHPEKHQSILTVYGDNSATISRILDTTKYFVNVGWKGKANIAEKAEHYFVISPGSDQKEFSFSCLFSSQKNNQSIPDYKETKDNSEKSWKNFWETGGVVDFTGSTDPRAAELERRIVLSQYLMKANCTGSVPPQETGLTFNSWYGKFHLEMHWWHESYLPLWGHANLLEKSMNWYKTILPKALELAKMQGFEGARWPKMTDPSGNNSPSSIGSVLIWQEPHIIYFAEECYLNSPDTATLNKYSELVDQTARFMASYAWYQKDSDRFILGPALIPAQETLPAETTINPPYELAYWYWGLSTAQKWRERLGKPREAKWDEIISKLSHLAELNGLYLGAESAPDTYSNPRYMSDHPSVLAAYGIMPLSPLVDSATMSKTFEYIWKNWHWEDTWGWDFPMTAMCATRLGQPEKAIDALFMDSQKNTYLANGHNYQDPRLRIYLPGNGGLLTAIAMMCAGYDGCKIEEPGIPKNGKWKVRWEGLKPLP